MSIFNARSFAWITTSKTVTGIQFSKFFMQEIIDNRNNFTRSIFWSNTGHRSNMFSTTSYSKRWCCVCMYHSISLLRLAYWDNRLNPTFMNLWIFTYGKWTRSSLRLVPFINVKWYKLFRRKNRRKKIKREKHAYILDLL